MPEHLLLLGDEAKAAQWLPFARGQARRLEAQARAFRAPVLSDAQRVDGGNVDIAVQIVGEQTTIRIEARGGCPLFLSGFVEALAVVSVPVGEPPKFVPALRRFYPGPEGGSAPSPDLPGPPDDTGGGPGGGPGGGGLPPATLSIVNGVAQWTPPSDLGAVDFYRVTITAPDGAVIYSAYTSDTTLSVTRLPLRTLRQGSGLASAVETPFIVSGVAVGRGVFGTQNPSRIMALRPDTLEVAGQELINGADFLGRGDGDSVFFNTAGGLSRWRVSPSGALALDSIAVVVFFPHGFGSATDIGVATAAAEARGWVYTVGQWGEVRRYRSDFKETNVSTVQPLFAQDVWVSGIDVHLLGGAPDDPQRPNIATDRVSVVGAESFALLRSFNLEEPAAEVLPVGENLYVLYAGSSRVAVYRLASGERYPETFNAFYGSSGRYLATDGRYVYIGREQITMVDNADRSVVATLSDALHGACPLAPGRALVTQKDGVWEYALGSAPAGSRFMVALRPGLRSGDYPKVVTVE